MDPSVKARVGKHILESPKVQSHYIRKDFGMEYIEEGWNVAMMHRAYVKWMNGKKIQSLENATDIDFNSIPVEAVSDMFSNSELIIDDDFPQLLRSTNDSYMPQRYSSGFYYNS